jgi:hypothetical protein
MKRDDCGCGDLQVLPAFAALQEASKRLQVDDDWGLAVDLAMRQQLALLRLHLWTTGAVASLFGSLLDHLQVAVVAAAPDDILSPGQVPGIMVVVDAEINEWREVWFGLVRATRLLAAWVPQGTLNGLVDAAFSQPVPLQEQRIGFGFPSWDPNLTNPDGSKGGYSPVFVDYDPVVGAAVSRVDSLISGLGNLRYSDGKNLSDRVWAIPAQVRAQVLGGLRVAAVDGASAYTAARAFETWLQPGGDCTRWTTTRLRLTKAQIAAGDRAGLYSGNPCKQTGVAYKALRLLRNEIQIAHHAATDQVFSKIPWIDQERIVLSPDHPDIGCECEDVVVGGIKGDGVYPKGGIALPIHVQCLCFKIPVLMPRDEFVRNLRGWMNGTSAWAAMDEFEQWFGAGRHAPAYAPTDDEEKEALEAAEASGTGTDDLAIIMDVLADGDKAQIDDLVVLLVEEGVLFDDALELAYAA